jgi:multiple sugar transport system permease protein
LVKTNKLKSVLVVVARIVAFIAVCCLLFFQLKKKNFSFDQFYIITAGRPEGETQTIAFYLFRQAFLAFRLGYGAALSVILAVLLMIISLIQIKLSRMDTHE